jgi:hypothetical protein
MDELKDCASIGFAAGDIWKYLLEHGQSSSVELKAGLGLSNTMLCLALGWLAREDKIVIAETPHGWTAKLK